LASDGLAILQPAVTHQSATQTESVSQTTSSGVAIEVALLDPDQTVLTDTGGLESKQLIDHKIFRASFKGSAPQRATVEERGINRLKRHEGRG
jgi:hypothetical protein